MAGIPTNVAQLMAVLSLNTAPFKAEAAAATGMMGATGPLAMAAVGVGAVIAGVGVIATKMAGDFQKGLTSLVTGAGESQRNLKMVSAGILQLSQDTGTSTQQLIDGMYMIESGGFHGAAGLAVLKAAAEGAKVGSADLGTIADTVDTILKNFGEDGALTATQATNALITTVANGKVHLEALAESLAQVLPAGRAAGLSLKDVLGAMAELTNLGLPAAESATYLRQAIIALEAPSAGAKNALASIGVTTDELSTKMKQGLPQALLFLRQQLDAHGIKEGSSQYIAAIREISGGTRQMQALLNLMGGEGTSHDNLKDFAMKVGLVGSAATKTGTQVQGWALVQQNMNQQFDRAKQVAGALFIELGQNLLPVATNLFKFLADTGLPAIKNVVTWFGNAKSSSSDLKPVLIAVAGVIGGTLVTALGAYTVAAIAAAAASFEISVPMLAILAIGAGIGALIAILVTHWNEWTKKGGPLNGVLQALHPILQKLGDLFGLLGQIWTTQILPALAQLLPILKIVGIVIGVALVAAIGLTIGIAILLVVAITGVILIIVKLVQGIVFLLSHIGDIQKAVRAWAHDLAENITKKLMEFQQNVMKWGHDLAAGVTKKFMELQQSAIQKAHDLAAGVIGWFTSLQKNVQQWAHDLVENATKKFMELQHNLIQKGHDIATNFIDTLKALPGKMLSLGEQLLKSLAQGLQNGRSAVVSAIANIPILGGIAGGINKMLPKFAAQGGTFSEGEWGVVGENNPETIRVQNGRAIITPLAGGRIAASPAGTSGGSYANGSPIVIIVKSVLDGRVVAQNQVQYTPRAVRNATGSRK